METFTDQLPALHDEADEVMGQLAFYTGLLSPARGSPAPPPSGDGDSTSRDAMHPATLRHQLGDVDIEAILKTFHRHFAAGKGAPTVDKLSSSLPESADARQALKALVAHIVRLMKKLQQWQQMTFDLLVHFFLDPTHRQFEAHRPLTCLVLNTLVKYVKLHIFWTSLTDVPAVLSMHALFVHLATTNDPRDALEHPDKRLYDYVAAAFPNPIPKLQQDFQCQEQVANHILELVMSSFDAFVNAHDIAHLRNQGVFDFDNAMAPVPTTAAHRAHLDLLYAHDQTEWVLATALCLPNLLVQPDARSVQLWEFLKIASGAQLNWLVHRDQACNVLALLHSSLTASDASHLRKDVARLVKSALLQGIDVRRERQQFCLWALSKCQEGLDHNPALVAPMFPMLLAVLATCKSELEWILAHQVAHAEKLTQPPLKHKHWVRVQAAYDALLPIACELAARLGRLRSTIASLEEMVTLYYDQVVTGYHCDAVAYYATELLYSSAVHDLEPGIADRLVRLASSDSSPLALRDQFAQFGVDWERTSLLLQGPSVVATTRDLVSVLNTAWWHTRFTISTSDLLETYASLSKCWWASDALVASMRKALAPAHSRSLVVALVGVAEVMHQLLRGVVGVHEIVESTELEAEVTRLRRSYQDALDLVADAVVRAIEHATARQAASRQTKAQVDDVMHQLIGKRRSSQPLTRESGSTYGRAGSASVIRKRFSKAVALPAVEESEVDDSMLGDYAAAEELVQVFGQLLARSPQPLQHDLESVLATKLEAFTLSKLRRALVVSTECKTVSIHWVRQLSLLRAEMDGAADLVHRAFTVRTASVLLTALRKELTRDSASPLSLERETVDCSFVELVAKHMASLAATKCRPSVSDGLVVGTRHGGRFIAVGPTKDTSALYTAADMAELVALVGSASVNQLAAMLLVEVILPLATSIGQTLEQDKTGLVRFGQHLAGREAPSEAAAIVRLLKRQDDFVTLAIHMGIALRLRSALLLATSEQSNVADAEMSTVRSAIRDVGGVNTAWSLLPLALAASFHHRIWKSATYLADDDASVSNAHVMMIGGAFLLRATTATATRAPGDDSPSKMNATQPGDEEGDNAATQLRRNVVRLCGTAMMRLRSTSKELPSLAMVHSLRRLHDTLAARSRAGVASNQVDEMADAHQHAALEHSCPHELRRLLEAAP